MKKFTNKEEIEKVECRYRDISKEPHPRSE